MSEPQMMTGVILPNGELRLDEPLVHAPERVRVLLTEFPIDSEEDSPWSRLETGWCAQRARHYHSTEIAALEASDTAQPQESPVAEMLSSAAADLRDCMSQLSEDCYCAGWIGSLEYLLWTAVMNGPVETGNWKVTQSDIERLRLLARRCGGWIVWDDVLRAAKWLPIEDWLRQFDTYIAADARKQSPYGIEGKT